MPAISSATLARKFQNDERGAVALMFGLMFMILATMTGVAIDYSRLFHTKTRVVSAVDAAALAAGRALLDGRLSDTEIIDMAREYFTANLNDGGPIPGSVAEPDINVDRSSGEVTIDVDTTVEMTITKIAGFNEFSFPVNSASVFERRDIELGMALDVTGSMSGQKIQDLRNAAKDLVDILLPDDGNANKVRIGLAPYATSLNAGPYAEDVTGLSGGHTCVHERGGSERFTDAEPTGANKLEKPSDNNCPSVTVLPMTDNKSLLKSTIDTYNTGGWTAGHLGAAWAWYLVSPNWGSIWPAESQPEPYGGSSTMKAVILMTDGKFNKEYVFSNGDSGTQARSLCAEMRANNVQVYSVAFQAPSSAQALLQDCASSDVHYFSADNGEELRQAFQKIALKLNNLRLSN